MFSGPLSERIDWITEKLLGENQKKPKVKKLKLILSAPDLKPKSVEDANLWDATQLSCPIPPRNPDGWIH